VNRLIVRLLPEIGARRKWRALLLSVVAGEVAPEAGETVVLPGRESLKYF